MKAAIATPLPRPDSLVRAAFVSFLSTVRTGSTGGAEATATKLYPQDHNAHRILTRAASSPLTAADATALASVTGDFIAGLAPLSAGARLVAGGARVNLAEGAQVSLPMRTNPAVPLAWVGEGGAIPVRSFGLSKVTVGPVKKAAVIAVHSRELAKQASAETIFATLLRQDAAVSFDSALFAATDATDDAPAGLLFGVAPLTATAGADNAAMEADLINLAAEVTSAGGTSVLFVCAPRQAEAVVIRKPELAPRVIASAALTAGTVIAIDPAALVAGFGFEPEIESSNDAAVHMDTAPLAISTTGTPNVVAARTRSMFQENLIATRILLDMAFALRAPGLIAVIRGATW